MKENIHQLLEKYSRNACSEEELRQLEAWFLEVGNENIGTFPDEARVHRMLEQIQASPRYKRTGAPAKQNRLRVKRIIAVASAAAILLFGIGVALYWSPHSAQTETASIADIAAGGDKAILTLADGKRIVLDGTGSGTVAQENGITIQKNADKSLTYTVQETTGDIGGKLAYHTIETPRGGQYRVVLSDGSTIWLNAESSLTFPARFSPTSRDVKVTGEAYFAVVPRKTGGDVGKRIPFIVETDQQRIEVLGTEFNVNTYPDQPAQQTTLVEGSVRVRNKNNDQHVVLEPGQKAQGSSTIQVTKADLEREIAWKNGDFIFKNDQLSHILQQVSRWYDITVSYPEHLAELPFSGMVSRQRPLSSIIAMLESTGVLRVKIQERRIIIE